MAEVELHISWHQWFSAGSNRNATEPAKDILDSSPNFKEISAQRANEETTASDQIHSKEDLLKVIDHKATSSELDSLEAQKLLWSAKRKKGLRKFPRLLQSFMTRFADFLEAYSGIVEIVKQADSQYGGLAYSTLSLLLLVAVNKSKREEKIESVLDDLRWQLPRVNKLQKLIPSNETALLLSKLYTKVINFARTSITYYTGNSFKRVIGNMLKPPKLYIDKQADEINSDISKVEKEVAIVTYERIHLLEQRKDEDRLNKARQDIQSLRKRLGLDLETDLAVCDYRKALHDPSATSKKHQTFDRTMLSNTSEFNSWCSSIESGLFLLHGETLNPRTGFSWLSPAALDVLEMVKERTDPLANTGKDPVVLHYLAHTTAWITPDTRKAADKAISHLICELLDQEPSYMFDVQNVAHIENRIGDAEFWTPNPWLPCALLREILDQCAHRQVYIVLDRIDALNCSAVTLIERVYDLVTNCKAVVKVFAVVGSLGHFDPGDIMLGQESNKFFVLKQDQTFHKKGM